jgi:F-type H+-transporting ATPase subunit gamma
MAQKDIKNRIASVKNIQKITRAMQMVAAARLRRAEQRIEQLRPYAAAIRRMTRQAAEAAGHIPRLPILTERPEQRSVGLLLVTGDRGLAGAFNSQILRAGLRAAREHQEAGRTPSYYASGKRGTSSLLFRGLELRGRYTGFTDRPAYANAREIAEDLMTAYIDGKLDSVEIVYNHYISPLSQVVRRETLLPLQQATILESDESAAAVRPTPSTSGGSPSARPAPQSRALASSGNEQDAGGRGLRPRHRSLRSLGGGEPPDIV